MPSFIVHDSIEIAGVDMMKRPFTMSRQKAVNDMRIEGDSARDMKNWAEAEVAYRSYLDEAPDDFAILVQYGHVLKEQEKFEAALNAYENARALQPTDIDVATHLAYLLKRQGRITDAGAVFAEIYANHGSRFALDEMKSLSPNIDAASIASVNPAVSKSSQRSDVIFIELDDMLNYLHAHPTLSGIQRVQASVVRYILSQASEDVRQKHLFVLNESSSEQLWLIGRSDLLNVLNYLDRSTIDHHKLRELLKYIRQNASAISPNIGSTLFILGSFWGYENLGARYLYLKKSGLKLGAFVYDLIPISHFEFCDARLSHDFSLSFADASALFDFFIAISEFTARDVRAYFEKYDLPIKQVEAVPLAHVTRDDMAPQETVWSKNISFLKDRTYVLFVSTIEGRKNHMLLVSIWKQFVSEGLDPPDLVFVGRTGWRIASLLDFLQTTDNLNGKIHILNDLSDLELTTLYSNCLYTTFPSFVEGWGLPVGESLAHQKACVASSSSSIPEVGGDFVDYVDPLNLREATQVIRRMTFDHVYRMKREENISNSFIARRWLDVSVDLLRQIDSLSSVVKHADFREPLLESGRQFRPEDLCFGRKLPIDYPRFPTRLIFDNSWYGIENPQCWMKGEAGSLCFRTDVESGVSVVVYLTIAVAPWANGNEVAVFFGQPQRGRSGVYKTVRPGHLHHARCYGVVNDEGTVTVSFVLRGSIEMPSSDHRRFAIGIVSLGYAAKSDLINRIELLETRSDS